MIWKSIKIGKYACKITGLKAEEREYADCDAEGRPIKKVTKQTAIYEWQDEAGQPVGSHYKLINDQPAKKLKATKEITNHQEVSKTEALGAITESFYLLENELLYDYLKEKDIALKFVYSNGNGFKAYYAYVYIFGDDLIMVCSRGNLTKQISKIKSEQKETKTAVSMVEDTVKEADVMALIDN